HSAAFVKESLQNNCLLAWHNAKCYPGGTQVADQLFGRSRGDAYLFDEPIQRCTIVLQSGCALSAVRRKRFIEPPSDVHPQPRDGRRELGGSGRCFTNPEGNRRGLTLGILDSDFTRLDTNDAPGAIPQLENVSGHTFYCKILIHSPNEGTLGIQNDIVI